MARKESKPIRKTTKGKGANYRPTKSGAGTELGVRIGEALLEASIKDGDADEKGFAEGIKLAIEIQKTIEESESKSKL